MKLSFLPLFLLLLLALPQLSPAQAPRTTQNDLSLFEGFWKGSLTYLDYSTGKPYTMPAQTRITVLPQQQGLKVEMIYPDEPRANNTDTLWVDAAGQSWDGAKLVSRTVLPDGQLQLVTEVEGRDGNDNLPATLRKTITIGPKTYVSRKEVQFKGTTAWVQRHEYRYTKD